MTQTYTNAMGQNYREGTVTALNEVIQLASFLTWGFVSICLKGTWTGVITFEACNDPAATFFALPMTPIAGGATVTTASANGLWYVQNTGFSVIQARFSTATSGTPVIAIRSLPGQV